MMRMNGYVCALNFILVTTVYESNGSDVLLSKTLHVTGNDQNGKIIICKRAFKPLSHWTATVLRQLVTDIASGSQSSLETVASDS